MFSGRDGFTFAFLMPQKVLFTSGVEMSEMCVLPVSMVAAALALTASEPTAFVVLGDLPESSIMVFSFDNIEIEFSSRFCIFSSSLLSLVASSASRFVSVFCAWTLGADLSGEDVALWLAIRLLNISSLASALVVVTS